MFEICIYTKTYAHESWRSLGPKTSHAHQLLMRAEFIGCCLCDLVSFSSDGMVIDRLKVK